MCISYSQEAMLLVVVLKGVAPSDLISTPLAIQRVKGNGFPLDPDTLLRHLQSHLLLQVHPRSVKLWLILTTSLKSPLIHPLHNCTMEPIRARSTHLPYTSTLSHHCPLSSRLRSNHLFRLLRLQNLQPIPLPRKVCVTGI